MTAAEVTDWALTIRLGRTAKRWTQRQLAAAVGTSQSWIARVESGEHSPSAESVERIMAALDGAPLARVPRGPEHSGQAAGNLHELSVPDMIDTNPADIDWLVDGLVARGYVTMLAGREGAGKSLLTQALAVGVAAGRPVAGLECQPGRVWLVDAENGPQLIHGRLKALGIQPPAARRLRVFDADGFDIQRDRSRLIAELENAEHRPDLLVLDSWKSLWGGSEQNPGAVTVMLNELRDLARSFALAIILIHHTTKASDTYRGSTATGATVEAVFTFAKPHRPKDGAEHPHLRELVCRKMRLGAEPGRRYLSIGGGGKLTEADYPWGIE